MVNTTQTKNKTLPTGGPAAPFFHTKNPSRFYNSINIQRGIEMTVVQLIQKLEAIKEKVGDVEVKVVIESDRFNTEVDADFVDELGYEDGSVSVGIVGESAFSG
jgi:hypothetical protein